MTGPEKIERNHMLDLLDEPFADLVKLHQESCSTDEDYPGWNPELGCCAADVIIKARRAEQREQRRARKAHRRPTQTEYSIRWVLLSTVITVWLINMVGESINAHDWWVAAVLFVFAVASIHATWSFVRDLAKRVDSRG